LLDTVSEAEIDANVDPDDRDGDGIRGIRNMRSGDGVRKPARFGHKANDWDLLRFLAGAMMDEMGVSNTVRRQPVGDDDGVPDPEVSRRFVMRVDAYVRNLAAPKRGPTSDAARRGQQLFDGIGCTGCHKPTLGKVKGAFTDLLLHNMGPKLDSHIKDGLATGAHWRTAPLWGLRHRKRYLHDERAGSVDEVMAQHLGEAGGASARFRKLPSTSRDAIFAFLASL
jgi:CxxC motif-containing protein (DUF1111 family)